MKQATKQNPQKKTVKLTRIVRQKPKVSKGRTYVSLGICIEGFNGWINGFENDQTISWENGDQVDLLVWLETYTNKDGEEKTAYKFKLPPDKVGKVEFQSLFDRVTKLELELSNHLNSEHPQMLDPSHEVEPGGRVIDKVKDIFNGEEIPSVEDKLPF